MTNKFIHVWTLALLEVVIVGNLQVLPANAQYGYSLPFFYLIAIICFYLPTVVLTSKLSQRFPQTGGSYIWCEAAFGKHCGFFVIALLWISNLLWYPSIFALIAANLAYLFNAIYATDKAFVLTFSLLFFWGITLINCFGIRFSIRVSILCSIIGIILPTIIVILCGITWILLKEPLAISLDKTPLIPDFNNMQYFGYLLAIVVSLFGIEVSAIHAGNVLKPKRDFPLSLMFASVILVVLLLGSECAIALIVPQDRLNVETGLLDAFVIVFAKLHLNSLLFFILLIVLIGNLGSVAAWMLGSTRGMFIASRHNQVLPFLQRVNRFEAPYGVLLLEAVIFTLAATVFLAFPNIVDSFWLLVVISSQITLCYYVVLFAAAFRLGCPKPLMVLGSMTAIAAFILGFFPPLGLSAIDTRNFYLIMIVGLIFALLLPAFFLNYQKK